MTKSERTELMDHIRQYMLSGKLDDEAFADMALMYATLLDPNLLAVIDSNQDGESFARLKKYEGDEPGNGWPEISTQVLA